MNALTRRTTLLVIGVVAMCALDVTAHLDRTHDIAPLPAIPAVDADAVRTITLEHGDDTVLIDRAADGWALGNGAAADAPAVEAVLRALGRATPMDVRVGSGEFDTYGLAGADPIRVAIAGETGTLAEFYVGNDATGGTSFVRFPGSDDVYRARIGGRTRWERTPGAWRDHQVLAFDPAAVDDLSIEYPDGRIVAFHRSIGIVGELGPWEVTDNPPYPVDGPSVDELVAALSHLRAGEVRPPDQPSGTDNPAATLTIHLADDTSHMLLIGRADGTFARTEGKTDVFRIAPGLLDRTVAPAWTWRDRTLLAFDAGDARRLELRGPRPIAVARDASGAWKAEGLDPNDVAALVAALSTLRADTMVDVDDTLAGLPGDEGVVIGLASGETALAIGARVPDAAADAVYVRSDRSAGVGVLSLERWNRIRGALGR